jgi:ABC-type dipeptide/oligopeptide/nickel transport system permease component
MARFLVRRFVFLVFTMVFVSMVVFAISELAPGDVVRHMLGQFATPEQEDSLRAQLGLNRPVWVRYVSWLVGSDLLWAQPRVGLPLVQTVSKKTGFTEWWAQEADGTFIRWRLDGEDLIAVRRQSDGSVIESVDNGRWNVDPAAEAKRLKAYRDELQNDGRLLEQDRKVILQEVDRLIAMLDGSDGTTEQLTTEISGPEESLDALRDAEAGAQRQGLQIAATGLLQNDVVQALSLAQTLTSDPNSLDEETLKTVPNRLGKAATVLSQNRPEVAEGLRQASKLVLSNDLKGAGAALEPTIEPLQELTKPVTDLAHALENDEYGQAATILETLFDPAATPDAALVALMANQLKNTAGAIKDMVPELVGYFDQAAASLNEEDLPAAQTALAGAATYLRERGPVIVRNQAAKRAKVGRYFWGVDSLNHAVLWETAGEKSFWLKSKSAGWWVEQPGGATDYIPLQKGFLRGDPGESVRTRQPVAEELLHRLRNSGVLAGLAFVVVMPLALLMGLVAGLNEGKPIDRGFSVFGLITTASPEFATGVFLILIFSVWLKVLPGATVFTSASAIFENPEMLVLPVATLTLIELGYVLRITRASMVEVMKTPYIRTAFLKGLPYRRIVFRHAVRNALMAPITVIMLHVNWLMGGIVVVEAIFGFPGLGNYLLTSALYKDVFAIEAGAMVMVILAVGTQLIADVIYTFLNPRIRYA